MINEEVDCKMYDCVNEENTIQNKLKIDVFDVADLVSDGIYISDKKGVVISVNKAYSQITGIEASEIIGKNIQTILDGKYVMGDYIILQDENINKAIKHLAINSNEPCFIKRPTAICRLVLQQKKEVFVLATLSVNNKKKKVLFMGKPYFDENGVLTNALIVMRDLTELLKLKQKLEDVEKENSKYLNELLYLRNNQPESELLGKDESTENIRQLITQVAKTDATVMITGETGVGKEVIAREIYRQSSRSSGPYIKVNCAAIPENLLESEMFGYEKGSFTGALKKDKPGYFEMAHGGTILLDEIGEMPVKLQSKLLRTIQEREVRRIGGTKSVAVDVRIIASTNRNIQKQIKDGTFRSDLYYRLNVIPIKVAPLRERKADIAILANKFVEKFAQKYNKNKELDLTAIDVMESYEWLGNVRELENAMERLVIIGENFFITGTDVINMLGKDKLQYNVIDDENLTLKESMNIIEKNIIEKALKKHKSSRKAAKALGVSQPTVLRKANILGIKEW
jgi:transcriptional regulator with PAS, ATPase and Fis domain